ncbi:hypothetical protein DFH28DRAFT_824192, partial [Melampsora americana]
LIEVAGLKKATAEDQLTESKLILRSLYSHLIQNYTCLWLFWSGGMKGLINQTKPYSCLRELDEMSVSTQWDGLVGRSQVVWQANSQVEIFEAAPLDEGEVAKERLMELEVIEDEAINMEEDEDTDGDNNLEGDEDLRVD